MGEYFKAVNLTKREFLFPPGLGESLKVRDWGDQGPLRQSLHILQEQTPADGGDELAGRWRGDHVIVLGDYDEGGLINDGRDAQQVWAACLPDGLAEAFPDEVPSDPFTDLTAKLRHRLTLERRWRFHVSDHTPWWWRAERIEP